jgi:hypothetical protein
LKYFCHIGDTGYEAAIDADEVDGMAQQPKKPTDDDAIAELAEVFDEERAARALLERIEYPRGHIPSWSDAGAFWHSVARQIRAGILSRGNRLEYLIRAAAASYPGNHIFATWLGPAVKAGDSGRAQNLGATLLLSTGLDVYSLLDLVRALAQERGTAGPVELLWASGENVGIHLQGVDSEQALRIADLLFQRLDGQLRQRPSIAPGRMRDHLIHQLFIEGPDSARFELNGVPSSTLVRHIARTLTDQYDDEVWPREQSDRPRPTVVNHVQPNGTSVRVPPDKTLHEANIGEGSTLRVASESIAGGPGPAWGEFDRFLTDSATSSATAKPPYSQPSPGASPLIQSQPVKVLVLAANPLDANRIRVDAETRAIQMIARSPATVGRRIEVEVYPAVQIDDLIEAIEFAKPAIIHFAGHGESGGGLILDDGRGAKRTVTFGALGQLFTDLRGDGIHVRCLVLNGCYSAEAIPSLGEIVDVLIGNHQEIADESSLEFARGFYTSIAEGKSVAKAISRGKLRMKLAEPPSNATGSNPWVFDPEKTIVVNVKKGLDLERTFL